VLVTLPQHNSGGLVSRESSGAYRATTIVVATAGDPTTKGVRNESLRLD
jgi:hypothetical protein